MKPDVHTAHSHEILFTTHTYLTFVHFPLSTLTAGLQLWIRVGVELFTRPSFPLSPRPHMKGLGTKLVNSHSVAVIATGYLVAIATPKIFCV